MSSLPVEGYCLDSNDDVDMKPFPATLQHVSRFDLLSFSLSVTLACWATSLFNLDFAEPVCRAEVRSKYTL